MKYNNDLSAEQVRELLDYDPETGVFTWKIARGRAGAGSTAGHLSSLGYRRLRIEGCLYQEHRLAWLHFHGEWPTDQIDHINCDKSDNRVSNLREATGSQNQGNSPIPANNTSGFKGASWNKRDQKWQAKIRKNGHQIHLGHFATAEAAHEAYCIAANDLHGEFARTA